MLLCQLVLYMWSELDNPDWTVATVYMCGFMALSVPTEQEAVPKKTQFPIIPTKGLHWGPHFLYTNKMLQSFSGLLAHPWSLMGSQQCPDEEHSALCCPSHLWSHPILQQWHSPSAWASTVLHWGYSAFYTTQDICMSQHLWVLSGAGPIWIPLLAVLKSIVKVFPQLRVIQHKLLK